MNAPDLSVVVLAWNLPELTSRCVESIRRQTDVGYELIIVDNGSDPEAADLARDLADRAVLNPTNLGFAPGMNRGLEVARGRHVAFVNNDTQLPPQWASSLLSNFAGNDRCGIALPAVTAAGNPYAVRESPGTDRIVVPPFRFLPSGVVYVMDRTVVEALGGWGEEFLVASREDLDLLFKVWVNDLDVVLDERVLVAHESSATADTVLDNKEDVWRHNWDVFTEKWTSADAARIPRLPSCDPAEFERRLDEARTVATWMVRWFDAAESGRAGVAAQKDKNRELRKQLATLAKRVEAIESGRTPRPTVRSWLRAVIPRRGGDRPERPGTPGTGP